MKRAPAAISRKLPFKNIFLRLLQIEKQKISPARQFSTRFKKHILFFIIAQKELLFCVVLLLLQRLAAVPEHVPFLSRSSCV